MPGSWFAQLARRAPSRCAVCGAWPTEPVCGACLGRFAPPQPRCRTCALPVPGGVERCGACVRQAPPLERCHAAVSYAYPWAGLLTHYKFGNEPGWAQALAQLLLADAGVQATLAEADVVMPLPLSPERLAQRGFNQALQIARALAPAKVRADLLLRLRDTAPQTALGRKQREANVRGAFAVEPLRAASLRGQRLVLVDDVMTSGASIFAAAGALRAVGCAAVAAMVVARTDEPG
jgi:ComF family protein